MLLETKAKYTIPTTTAVVTTTKITFKNKMYTKSKKLPLI